MLLASLAMSAAACQDAPITADQLQPDGRLRAASLDQAAFSAEPTDRIRSAVQVSAVLAAEAEGALEDRSTFGADVGTVHLHLRADGLLEPRPVIYRWTHEDLAVLVPGTLAPTSALSLGTSFAIDPEETGRWEVEVLTKPRNPEEAPQVLFHRAFEIRPATQDS